MRTWRREVGVALSTRTQPVWFRILTWSAFLGVAVLLRRRPALRVWLVAVPVTGVGMHLVYRWRTRGWTRSWGGWSADVPESVTHAQVDARDRDS